MAVGRAVEADRVAADRGDEVVCNRVADGARGAAAAEEQSDATACLPRHGSACVGADEVALDDVAAWIAQLDCFEDGVVDCESPDLASARLVSGEHERSTSAVAVDLDYRYVRVVRLGLSVDYHSVGHARDEAGWQRRTGRWKDDDVGSGAVDVESDGVLAHVAVGLPDRVREAAVRVEAAPVVRAVDRVDGEGGHGGIRAARRRQHECEECR